MLAVQTKIGQSRGKATTKLSWDFSSMINAGGQQYGCSSGGICLLNVGDKDDGQKFTRSFSIATSDFMVQNNKRVRFLYIGIATDNNFTVSVRADSKIWIDYQVTPPNIGLQEVRVPIGRRIRGRYFTVRVSSYYQFTVDSIKALLVTRNNGAVGGTV